jgi:cell division septal protein FtsQ
MDVGQVAVDGRLVARRRQVAETRVRSSVSRLVLFMGLAGVGAFSVWLFRSPFLAINEINVGGVIPSEVARIVDGSGVEIGQPLVGVRVAQVETALLSDPRNLRVQVDLNWPHAVAIQIEPRQPVAWTETTSGWALLGRDGVVIETAEQPRAGVGILEVGGGASSPEELAGLAFLAELHPVLAPTASVTRAGEELWATVGGFTVRLGRPIEMEAKARALNALLAAGVEAGSTINLLAPTRPAVVAGSAGLSPDAQP